MRLYLFQCGTLKTQKHFLMMNKGLGEPIEIPVPFFLIQHDRHNVLFDTGNALEVAKDKVKHWGNITKIYDPIMTEDDYVVNQLATLGLKPEDITHVIFSHLHLDHAGGCGAFPNATYYVQREELKHAYVHDFYQKGAYIRADFDKPDLRWYLLDGYEEDYYDVLGDGKLQIIFTPGHTPGHQSLLVRLDHTGPLLLTGDSVYTQQMLEEDILPGLVYSPPDTVKTLKKIRNLRKVHGVQVVTGHDPVTWKEWKRAPGFYE